MNLVTYREITDRHPFPFGIDGVVRSDFQRVIDDKVVVSLVDKEFFHYAFLESLRLLIEGENFVSNCYLFDRFRATISQANRGTGEKARWPAERARQISQTTRSIADARRATGTCPAHGTACVGAANSRSASAGDTLPGARIAGSTTRTTAE